MQSEGAGNVFIILRKKGSPDGQIIEVLCLRTIYSRPSLLMLRMRPPKSGLTIEKVVFYEGLCCLFMGLQYT